MPDQQQDALQGLEACRVKFVDVSLDEIAEPPEIDDTMEFTVKATCVARTEERMKDGEYRRTAKMRVTFLEPKGGPIKPTASPAPTPLFKVAPDGEGYDTGHADPDDDGQDDAADGVDD